MQRIANQQERLADTTGPMTEQFRSIQSSTHCLRQPVFLGFSTLSSKRCRGLLANSFGTSPAIRLNRIADVIALADQDPNGMRNSWKKPEQEDSSADGQLSVRPRLRLHFLCPFSGRRKPTRQRNFVRLSWIDLDLFTLPGCKARKYTQ